MMNKKRGMSGFFALIFLLTLTAPIFRTAAEENLIEIRSEYDFKRLAERATLDQYTAGKRIVLLADLDFTDREFVPIPLMCGVFDGGGHTLRGISYTEAASECGVFRIVEAGGVVSDLTVDITMVPSGSRKNIGGLCGTNRGILHHCSFRGSIQGADGVGGIAAVNEGRIEECTASGIIYGEHYVGGICGKNYGTISGCVGEALVNTRAEKVTVNPNLTELKYLRSMENVSEMTDIGGIAGYSSGAILQSENRGTIGYAHVGYNVGGICGRQAGYLSGCTNTGEINGRKDIGGICGQTEPYTSVRYDRSALEQIEAELDRLENCMNSTIGNADITRVAFSSKLDAILGSVRRAGETAESLIEQGEELAEESVDTAQDLCDRLNGLVDGMLPLLYSVSDLGKSTTEHFRGYRTALETVRDVLEDYEADALFDAIDSASDAVDDLNDSMQGLADAMVLLEDNYTTVEWLKDDLGIVRKNTLRVLDSMSRCQNQLLALTETCNQIIKDAIRQDQPREETASRILTALSVFAEELNDELKSMYRFMERIGDTMTDIPAAIRNIDTEPLYHTVTALSDVTASLNSAVKKLTDAADVMIPTREEFDDTTDELKRAMDLMSETTDQIKADADRLFETADRMIALAESFHRPITFPRTDDRYQTEKDRLSEEIHRIADQTDLLHGVAESGTGMLSEDLQRLSDQLFRVMDAVSDAAESDDDYTYTEDVSDTDGGKRTDGKIDSSENRGKVSGDVNVGGIVGSMAIEYDFDPEDDIVSEGKKSLRFTLQTKSVVRGCVNRGMIEAKKNYVGGIVGRMDLGSVIESVACGRIGSGSGDYVGGIVGKSESVIRDSAAKCTLYGDAYVGGIVGLGTDLLRNYSLVSLQECKEYFGAIAGAAEGDLSDNYFTHASLGGIDGISYAKKTMPVSYEELIALPGAPDVFKSFRLTFLADDETVAEVDVGYGETLNEQMLPEVPEKEGVYGKWENEKLSEIAADLVIEAVYEPYITAIESTVKNENGMPYALAEGEFSDRSELLMRKCEETELPKKSFTRTLAAWDCEVTENHAPSGTIHYALPNQPKRITVYLKQDGSWKKCASSYDGNYLVFETNSETEAFWIVQSASKTLPILAGLLLLIVGGGLLFQRKRHQA